jgi:hypothetical protein
MTIDDAGTCACAAALPGSGENPIESFSAVRTGCPALRDVFVPDLIWQNFRDSHCRPDDAANHRSVLVLAHQRGCLNRATLPVHRYLLSSGTVRSDVRTQYIRDLQEKWILEDETLERHRKWRIFQGRLAELQCASWLEEQSYTILGLEALREGPDIEAISRCGVQSAFEVKFIGSEDTDFEMAFQSIAGQQPWYTVCPYTAINYLVFRTYEAAKQLQAIGPGRTVAVLIVDDMAWWRFERQLKGNWIDWESPEFVGLDPNPRWQEFIHQQRKRYPGFPNDLAATIRGIESIWIVTQSSEFEFDLKYEFRTRSR